MNFRFNPEGGRIFGDLTEANVGNLLAIILDENVYSAPVIRSRIDARTDRRTLPPQEAADLAVVLEMRSRSRW